MEIECPGDPLAGALGSRGAWALSGPDARRFWAIHAQRLEPSFCTTYRNKKSKVASTSELGGI